MSSQLLQSELLNLIQESKRKNADIRNAAEESLNDLKALPSTSEAQISADLVRKPRFVNPFILACHSRHAKLAGFSVVCLQRLVASKSLPSERLKDVLSGLKEITTLTLDIQLKILQTLPSLLQHYSNDLCGELLVTTLEICATLQSSKTLAVSSTAAATLQQLVVFTFERVSIEDQTNQDSRPATTVKVDGASVKIGQFALDALRVLDDLCGLADGEALHFLRIKSLSPTFALELLESVILNSGQLFVDHPELTQVLRTRLIPMTVRYLSERHTFAQTVRIARILLILLKRYLSLLTAECEMALSLLAHLLEPDGTSTWKRVLCMEMFRGLYAEPGLVRLIYSLYDGEEGRKSILRDHMASLVRLAAEKPSLIGVSSRSTVPLRAEHARSITEEQITLEVGGVAGVIGTSVPSNDISVPGISNQWSVVRSPYLELLDKTEPPPPPDTYIYSLALNCVSAFAEGLAKFILPLTVPDLKSKRRSRVVGDRNGGSTASSEDFQREDSMKRSKSVKRFPVPVNPLDLESHPQLSAVRTCAGIIEDCWPAVLATCSTFLYASLDDDFYHNLVRSFQKLAHVAGLLRLSTPRDAFLTTLGKASVPADASGVKTAGSSAATPGPQLGEVLEKRRRGSEAGHVAPQTPIEGPAAPLNDQVLSLTTRNLLCLRALLNLGIALGPTLDQSAWSIVLGTLQDTDLLVNKSPTNAQSAAGDSGGIAGGTRGDAPLGNLGSEILAVQAASTKLFESTSEHPSDTFRDFLVALLDLSVTTEEPAASDAPETSTGHGNSLQSTSGRMRRSSRRVSHALGKSRIQDEELRFVLEKAHELARANLERLSSLAESDQSVWYLLTDRLMSTAANGQTGQGLRLHANEVLNGLVFETMKQRADESGSERDLRQLRNLETLKSQVKLLYERSGCSLGSPSTAIVEVHEQSLETLKNILEQHAETFARCWTAVFGLISSVFGEPILGENKDASAAVSNGRRRTLIADSPRLIQVAYKSLQLIASDFLSQLPPQCRLDLVESFSKFALQQQVFNISLTTTSSFWNVSDFLHDQTGRLPIETHVNLSVSEGELAALAGADNPAVARNALWLLLLLRIVDITTDSRAEVRNCAVHTLLRIFDAYGQQLSPKAWCLCLNRVLYRMLEQIEASFANVQRKGSSDSDEAKAWTETTVLVIKGVSDLITNFLETIIQDTEFDRSWKRLLEYFQTLVGLRLLAFSQAVFSSLSTILLRVQPPTWLNKQSLQSVWLVWVNGHPTYKEDMLNLDHPNQEAAISYLRTFQQLYRLYKDELSNQDIEKILQHIRMLIWNSICPRYSPDIDRPSDLQALVIDCVKLMCLEKDNSQGEILRCLAEFADSALRKWSKSSDPRRPTYIAFSKSAIDLLSWYVAEYGIKQDIFVDGSLSSTLEHLANPIIRRYEWPGRDREPSLWRKSTTASLDVLQVAIPYVEKQYGGPVESEISQFWRWVVEIANGIIAANGYRTVPIPRSTLLSDEAFDIEAFCKLRCLIIPPLGSSAIPASIRRDFACALLHSSFIYLPQRFDLPTKHREGSPLEDVYGVRPGRTFDPPPTTRTRMAYVALDTLFELSSSPDHPTEAAGDRGPTEEEKFRRISIARSVSPYLILRCTVSLKDYIADQPLRGLMPQPTPARKVLLHLLEGMVNLRSEPSAIPPPPTGNIPSSSRQNQNCKMHLEWIYPLVVQAVQVAGKEREGDELLSILGEVFREVGTSV
ncbi:putative endosomal peripheral membrane protein (Mon2) [Aspergillus lucknowensis]|uniref:Endosomal peripheral membrane protein n=1 Tax=Aspergillus lucknowensis TaxID=176173 RepID=A0ABR4LMW5_9EURO